MGAIKVIIVEDNQSVRNALKSLIELSPDFVCLGDYSSCETIKEFSVNYLPDVILMDIDLPGENGIACTKRIKAEYPFINILMLTVIDSVEKIMESIYAGASGYLIKSALPESILESIRVIHKGGSTLTPSIARKVFESIKDSSKTKNDKIILNKRESEILSGLVEGLTYRMIAEKYFISVDTVRSYIRSIYEKLEVHSRSEAIVKAFKDKLI